jgi:hypothetical protein
MALAWGSFSLSAGSKFSDAIKHFVETIVPSLTYWRILGGGAATASDMFNTGLGGGIIERVSDVKQFVLHFNETSMPAGERFASYKYDWRDRFTTAVWQSTNQFAAFMMPAGTVTTKTQFLGIKSPTALSVLTSGITSGPFVRGETITIDAAGQNITATLDEVVEGGAGSTSEYTILFISGLSADITAHLNSKTVTGGTSLASGTTASATQPGNWYHADPVNTYYIRGGDMPVATDVITGSTTGHTATVSTADSATGKIVVTGGTGRFKLEETITWPTAKSSTIAYCPKGIDILGTRSAIASDVVIDTENVLYAEDADRLILLLPYSANSEYEMFGFGKWWDSLEGGGRLDGCFCGPPDQVLTSSTTNSYSVVSFLDHNGFDYGLASTIDANLPVMKETMLAMSVNPTMAAGIKESIFARNNTSGARIVHAGRGMLYRSAAITVRNVAIMYEFFNLPAETWRTTATPGMGASAAPFALYIDNNTGRCIEFNSTTVTP